MKSQPSPLHRSFRRALAGIACSIALAPAIAGAHEGPDDAGEQVPIELRDVGITEHVGEQIPLDVALTDEAGKPVHVGDYFKADKPVVLYFVYHSCPTLCSMVQGAVLKSLKDVPWDLGRKYQAVAVSIDPRDTPEVAAEKKQRFVAAYGRDAAETASGWHFLTGKDPEIHRLAEAIGFQYHFDAKQNQYAHAAAMYVLTPDGKLARYLYGIDFPAQDVRLALTEASQGRSVASALDKLLLYCYHYDPSQRGYVLQAWKVMRLGAAVTVFALAGLLGAMMLRERRRQKALPLAPNEKENATAILLPKPHDEKAR